MKATFVIGAFSFGGAERVICNLANYFASIGDDITLVALQNRSICYELDNRVTIINGVGGKNKFTTIKNLRKVTKDCCPDVVLSFMTHINIATIISLSGTGIPIVISERNDPKRMPPEMIRKLLRLIIYPFANGYVFQTAGAQSYFNKVIKSNSVIIPNPIYIDQKAIDINKRGKKIVTAGRLVEQKNHKLAIRAFARIALQFPEYKFIIYGDGPLKKELIILISELNMENRIFLEPATSNLHNEISDAEIFVLSSSFEGMPNVLMEAMGLGLACISTKCPSGGPEFLIEDSINGFLVPVNDEDSLANRFKLLLQNNDLRIEMSKKAMEINNKLNPEKVYKMWELFLYKQAGKNITMGG